MGRWLGQYSGGGLVSALRCRSDKHNFLPAKHWSKRGANDGGSRLWGSFWISGSRRSVYYSGDTGYGRHFREVRSLCGQPDVAVIGIGAYKPRWFMQRNHISPYEALDASAELGGWSDRSYALRHFRPFRRAAVRSSPCICPGGRHEGYSCSYT